jgi:hypothetical protein
MHGGSKERYMRSMYWIAISMAVLSAAAVGGGCMTGDANGAPDPAEVDHTGEEVQPVTCNPSLVYYPVRGPHNNGYDSNAGNSSLWTCNADFSNSDFVAGSHLGNDIWAARGTPVVATVSGTATLVGFESYSGNKVTIIDSCGWYHFSTHMDSIAPGITDGTHVTAGTVIGYVGNSGTGSNGVIHLHYSIYPDNNYDAGIDPWSYLRAVESNVCGGSTPPPTTQYWVDTFANATGYSSPGGTATGTLNAGTNYVFCKKWGPQVGNGSAYNHYWMLTDLDSGNPSRNQYVSAYYLSRWGNDEARDNNGTVLPDCP